MREDVPLAVPELTMGSPGPASGSPLTSGPPRLGQTGRIVDEPRWDCPNPDFSYAGCAYTFATLLFQKA